MTSHELLLSELGAAERLAAAYAPSKARARWHAVLALDASLARAALSPSETMAAQLRLAWWRDAFGRQDMSREHPVLVALGEIWTGSRSPLSDLVDAWEGVALDGSRGTDCAAELARARTAALAGEADDAATNAALCWTLASLAPHAGDDGERGRMLAEALAIPALPLARDLRPLAVLAGLARRSARQGGGELLGDRLSALAAIRLGIFGR